MGVSHFKPIRDLTKKKYSTSMKILGDDEVQNRVQYMQEKFINDNSAGDMAQSNRIENITVTTSGVNVNHKLGRVYTGFNVIKNSSSASVYVDDNNNMKDLIIKLKSSATTTVSIMVF